MTGRRGLKNPVISIGIFDGVHRGHAAIFKQVRMRAKAMEGESVIVTFWPHPRLVLNQNSDDLKLLTTLEEKKTLIGSHGIDHLIIIPFTREFSLLPACGFIKQYLIDKTGLKHLVFGFDHHFGHKREGNFENLTTCARKYRFTMEQLGPVLKDDYLISSSAVRQALFNGNVKLASRLLAYPYSLQGKIIGGKQVGREIGYPTANIIPDNKYKMIPADGVYAVRVEVGWKFFAGMMNIGFRPTVNRERKDKSLEVHIIGFNENVYDRNINISFIDRIRDERQFSSLDKLREQLARDKNKAMQMLAGLTGSID